MLVYVPIDAPKPKSSFNDILGFSKVFNDIKKIFNDMKSYHDNGELSSGRWNPFTTGIGNLTFTSGDFLTTSGTNTINFDSDTAGTFRLTDVSGGTNTATVDRVDHNMTGDGGHTMTVTGRVIS